MQSKRRLIDAVISGIEDCDQSSSGLRRAAAALVSDFVNDLAALVRSQGACSCLADCNEAHAELLEEVANADS